MAFALEGHTATLYGECLVIIGGKTAAFDLNESVLTLNITTCEWYRLTCVGNALPPRAYHSTCLHGSKLIVFGGITNIGVHDIHYNTYNVFTASDALGTEISEKLGSDRFQNFSSLCQLVPQRFEQDGELHILDMSHSPPRWETRGSLGSIPCLRSHHAAVVHGDAMYVMGGYNVYCTQIHATPDFGCLYHLDLVKMCWTTISLRTPLYYWGATLTPLGGTLFCLFGGVSRVKNRESQDTFLIDVRTGAVQPILKSTYTPLPRSGHNAWRWGCYVYVFGGTGAVATRFFNGLSRLDVQRGRWETVATCGAVKPPPLSGAGVAVVGEHLFLVGGLRSNLTRSLDVFKLNMLSLTWTEVDVSLISTSLSLAHCATNSMTSARLGTKYTVQRGVQTPCDWLTSYTTMRNALVSDTVELECVDVATKQQTPFKPSSQQTETSPLQRWERELRELQVMLAGWSPSTTTPINPGEDLRQSLMIHDSHQKLWVTAHPRLLRQPHH